MTALPDPTPLIELFAGLRNNAAIVAALEVRICEHLAKGACTAAELAARAKISERGAQALLDFLVGLGACAVDGGVYRNGPLAEAYLVPTSPAYVGDEEAAQFRSAFDGWARLTETVRTGAPARQNDSPEMLAFWTVLTPALGRRQRPLAEEVVRALDLTKGPVSLLDVGGGAGLYALALLRQNPEGRATQLDWPHINRIAEGEVLRAGLSARFTTIDGDFRATPPGGPYDVAVLSNILHQEAPPVAKDLMVRLRAALRPGGRLVVSEFVVEDGRTGPKHSLYFNLNMLVNTSGGSSYERASLRRLFREAGFAEPEFRGIGPVSTVVVGRVG